MRALTRLLNVVLRPLGLYAYWHSQNLNDRQGENEHRSKGSMWQHGRGWLAIRGIDHDETAMTFGLEWLFGRRARVFRVQLSLDGGDGYKIMLSLGVPWLFSLYPSIEANWLRPLMPGKWTDSVLEPGKQFWMPIEREMGISIHDGYIWFSLWRNPMEWSKSNPWWWEFSFNPADFFLGRSKYSERDLDSGVIDIELPEGKYPAKFKVFESTWKRPRWPWPEHMVRVYLEPSIPVPIPGKGESSWDLDDNAICSGTYRADTPQEAAAHLVVSVLRDRQRYGGLNWVPDAGWAV
jgi:hypothetical protein